MNTTCSNCKKDLFSENAFECEVCNRKDDEESDEESNEEIPKLFFCKKCTDTCFSCDVRGCEKCVELVCCDCGVSMCGDCRNNDDNLCGCYGQCFWCNRDVNRGSDGWPCYECKRWGCSDCRSGDNDCKECNPNYEEDGDEEATDEEDCDSNEEDGDEENADEENGDEDEQNSIQDVPIEDNISEEITH